MTLAQATSILVVDDDDAVRKAVRAALVASGFAVEEARDGTAAMEAVQTHRPDLVLLDMNMPGLTGVETCQRLRSLVPAAGIIMLTVRDTEEDKVSALEAGADDYVTKPFHFGELKSRVRAVLRRLQSGLSEQPGILRAGALTLDLNRRSLSKAGEDVHLSKQEFDLLSFLMKNQDIPLTNDKLLSGAWGPDYRGEREYLRTYIRLLRLKIEEDPAQPLYLLTEPWVGYRFHNPSGFEP
jgi:two-component system KDP operon response regulator KdpE